MDVGDDGASALIGLLTGVLDLVLGEFEAVDPLVPQLKGERVGDADEASPVHGGASSWVWGGFH